MPHVQVTGYHLGERFDLRALKSNLAFTLAYEDPTELLYEQAAGTFFHCFDYGSLVFCGVSEVDQTAIITALRHILALKEQERTVDQFSVEITSEAPYSICFDKVVLPELSVAAVRIITINIGQSVALEAYIEQSNSLVRETASYCTELEEKGTYSLQGRKLLKYIGRTLNLRNKIASNLYIFDSPQLTWNDAFLDQLNRDLARELDITQRYRCLTDNLDTVQENLEMFNDLSQHRHSSNLEWIIIILIAVEIAGFVFEKLW